FGNNMIFIMMFNGVSLFAHYLILFFFIPSKRHELAKLLGARHTEKGVYRLFRVPRNNAR
ncbi:MAG TPA: hypothetical protein PK283_09965, partial [Thiotrichales bacterium]|nr:hypothetical protein [Thiotrichales bacterium]